MAISECEQRGLAIGDGERSASQDPLPQHRLLDS